VEKKKMDNPCSANKPPTEKEQKKEKNQKACTAKENSVSHSQPVRASGERIKVEGKSAKKSASGTGTVRSTR